MDNQKPIDVLWWPETNVAIVRRCTSDYSFNNFSFHPEPRAKVRTGAYGVEYHVFDAVPAIVRRELVSPIIPVKYVANVPVLADQEITAKQYERLDERSQGLYDIEYSKAEYRDVPVATNVIELSGEPMMLDELWQSKLPHAALIEPELWGQAPCFLAKADLFKILTERARNVARSHGLRLDDSASIGGVRLDQTICGIKVTAFSIMTLEYSRNYASLAGNAPRIIVADLHAANMVEGREKLQAMLQRIDDIPTIRQCEVCQGWGYRMHNDAAARRSVGSETPEVTGDIPAMVAVPEGYRLERRGREHRWIGPLPDAMSNWHQLRDVMIDMWRHSITGESSMRATKPKAKKR